MNIGFTTNDFMCQAFDVALVMGLGSIKVGIKTSNNEFIYLKEVENTVAQAQTENGNATQAGNNAAPTKKTTTYQVVQGMGGNTIPAIAIRTPIKKLKRGDIIVENGRAVGFFINAGTEDRKGISNTIVQYVAISSKGGLVNKSKVYPANEFGFDFGLYAVPNSFYDDPMTLMMFSGVNKDGVANGNQTPLMGMMNMMLLKSFMDDDDKKDKKEKDIDFKKLLPMMMLVNGGNMAGGEGEFNPMSSTMSMMMMMSK